MARGLVEIERQLHALEAATIAEGSRRDSLDKIWEALAPFGFESRARQCLKQEESLVTVNVLKPPEKEEPGDAKRRRTSLTF